MKKIMLLAAFAALVAQGRNIDWLVVGDGILRNALQKGVDAQGLQSRVRFLGLTPVPEIADLLRASNVFALSSAYEGMPMALLEALGSGLPIATTDVGEVRRVVVPGINGAIALAQQPAAFATCLDEVLSRQDHYRGQPAVQAIQPYRPQVVLAPVYENYRAVGTRWRQQNA